MSSDAALRSSGAQERRFLAVPAVAQRYGKSRSTVWRWVARGVLPRPVRITNSTVGWWEDELHAWEQSRFGEGDPS